MNIDLTTVELDTRRTAKVTVRATNRGNGICTYAINFCIERLALKSMGRSPTDDASSYPASPKNIRKRMFPRKRNHDSRRCRCVVISRAFHRAVLQLCRSGLICCANAPCVIGFRSVQGEAIRNRKSSFWRFLRFSLSYRDVEELLAERGLHADHVTAWRWVQRYAPVMERRLRSRLRPTNDSWRVDETYIRVKGKWVYLRIFFSDLTREPLQYLIRGHFRFHL